MKRGDLVRFATTQVRSTFLGAAAIVVLLVVAQSGLVGLPRCPHCKRLLTGWLLHIAIASGNCGYCGKSVED